MTDPAAPAYYHLLAQRVQALTALTPYNRAQELRDIAGTLIEHARSLEAQLPPDAFCTAGDTPNVIPHPSV